MSLEGPTQIAELSGDLLGFLTIAPSDMIRDTRELEDAVGAGESLQLPCCSFVVCDHLKDILSYIELLQDTVNKNNWDEPRHLSKWQGCGLDSNQRAGKHVAQSGTSKCFPGRQRQLPVLL